MTLTEKMQRFRQLFVEYGSICDRRENDVRRFGSAANPDDRRREVELRTELRLLLGEIQPYTDRIQHVGWWYTNTATKVSYHVLDNALQETGMQQPGVRHLALHAIDKCIGALRSMTADQQRVLAGRKRRLFLAHAFREPISKLVDQIKNLAEAQGFDVVEGEPPRPGSVSDKVQTLIGTCEVCVGLMTADTMEGATAKASEWVRQEVSFAHGQGKAVVRMIENGVDTEGRLFGDDEYIALDLQAPADALVRFARMLAAIRR